MCKKRFHFSYVRFDHHQFGNKLPSFIYSPEDRYLLHYPWVLSTKMLTSFLLFLFSFSFSLLSFSFVACQNICLFGQPYLSFVKFGRYAFVSFNLFIFCLTGIQFNILIKYISSALFFFVWLYDALKSK